MRQTLFFIPHWLFEGPLLIAWLIIGLVVLGYLFYRHGNSNETWGFLPVYAIVAVVILYVLPQLEVAGIDPDNPTGPYIKLGLAIRGYGVCLLLAIATGVGLAMLRRDYVGLTVDQLLGLAFWMMVTGIVGARLFYIIQKSDEFFADGISLKATVVNVLDMTKGGLVVYGSLIGGMIAAVVYLNIHRLPFAKTADLIAPGMVLGLAIGRIGCLMNGCCFGGVCELPLPAIQFPAGSAPYMHQLDRGALIGIHAVESTETEGYPLVVESVERGSIADEIGVEPGDEFGINFGDDQLIRFQKENPDLNFDGKQLTGFIQSRRQGRVPIPISSLPRRSLNTHPTQVYSSINAGLLFLVLWFFWTVRKSDGEVFALMLILYPIGRFLLELIRQDELGQFGTELTISQWVSFGAIFIGISFLAYVRIAEYRSGSNPPLTGSMAE